MQQQMHARYLSRGLLDSLIRVGLIAALAIEVAEVEALQRLPAAVANKQVASKKIEKSQAATPNGKCSGRSGVPQVRALELLPNERAQCAYFVVQSQ